VNFASGLRLMIREGAVNLTKAGRS
jgi:hypothetical protein